MIRESSADTHDSGKARDVFFRVTGKPFNSLKPPKGNSGGLMSGRGDSLVELEFDDHLGGDEVAVRLKNLDLAESRFDGHVDATSRIGYGEWTMVFKNGSNQAKEARCQVRLPRDGRVSRLTLWVNGEPREAAFSTVAKVKAAYKAVAVVPGVLFTRCAPSCRTTVATARSPSPARSAGTRWKCSGAIPRSSASIRPTRRACARSPPSFATSRMCGWKCGMNPTGGTGAPTRCARSALPKTPVCSKHR